MQADVGNADAVEAAFARVAQGLGAMPRIAVNCAGIGVAARIVGREGKMSIDLFERVIRVNLIGSYIVMSHAVKGMQAQDPLAGGERGVVINTASAAWQDGQVGQSAYAASKGGIASMCLPAARELAQTGIRVMAIAPGLFNTPMMESLPPETTAKIVANIPFPDRLGDPAEYGLMVAQIVENASHGAIRLRPPAPAPAARRRARRLVPPRRARLGTRRLAARPARGPRPAPLDAARNRGAPMRW